MPDKHTTNMTTPTLTVDPATEYLQAWRVLQHFIGVNQWQAIQHALRGEEAPAFKELILGWHARIRAMPGIHESDQKQDRAMVVLHYFTKGFDWYITEKDVGSIDDLAQGIRPGEQLQAFGLACVHFDELGYIPISELLRIGVEFDLHWSPRSLARVKLERRFARTVPEFREKIHAIAGVCRRTDMEVFTFWNEYTNDCAAGDQSAVLGEFIEWFQSRLGADIQTLRAAIE